MRYIFRSRRPDAWPHATLFLTILYATVMHQIYRSNILMPELERGRNVVQSAYIL